MQLEILQTQKTLLSKEKFGVCYSKMLSACLFKDSHFSSGWKVSMRTAANNAGYSEGGSSTGFLETQVPPT